jgi:cellulose biosynthesis protein BcsQ
MRRLGLGPEDRRQPVGGGPNGSGVGMANGGGRGWFHRRKPRSEPAPTPEPESTRIEAYEAQQTEGRPDDFTPPPYNEPARRRDFDELMDPARSDLAEGSPPSRDDDDRSWAPPAREATAAVQSASESSVTHGRDRATVQALDAREAGTVPLDREGGSADEQSAVTSRPDRYDWDAATAAALSDEAVSTSAPTGGGLPRSEPDRLLEEIIREIVGDATAETVSSLHPAPDASPAVGPQDAPADTTEGVAAPSPGGDSSGDTIVGTGHTPPVYDSTGSSPHIDVERDGAATGDPVARPAPATPLHDPGVPAATAAVNVEYPSQGAYPAASSDGAESNEVASEEPSIGVAAAPTTSTLHEDVAALAGDVSRETPDSDGGTPLADQIADETRRRLALDEAVLPLPPATRVLTISNQKGGVGKTTSAVNLAAALARAGAHVLVIDLDPQGNASTALGVDHRSERQSVYEVLVSDLALTEVIQQSTEHERLDCVPATIHLAGAEIELVSLVAREQRLRRALDAHLATMDRPYDYVLIDCPPSLGLLTINAFVAAREVLIPIQCEYYALEGLSQLLSNIELIEKHLNPELRLSTILLTMYDSRTNLAQQVAQEVRDHFPAQTLDTIIPRSVRVSEAPSYGQSVISYDFASSGSLSYREAAAEIARRGASRTKENH